MSFVRSGLALFASISLLAACGGGGSSTPAAVTPPVSKIEGFYAGNVSSGKQFQLLALENDQVYALIGNTNAAGYFVISSFIEGLGTSANGSFSVANAKEYLPNGQALTGNVTGTFSPRATIMGTVQSPSGTASFTGTAPAASSYNYDVATPISAIAGNWSGTSLAGEATPFAITASGAISGRSVLGCTFTGTAAPKASGKNVFDVTITFGPAPCVLPAALVTGGAVTNLIPDGRRQLIVALTNSGRTAGTVIVAQR